jgi:hypothetical protein
LRFGDSAGALNKSTRENTAGIVANAIGNFARELILFATREIKRISDVFRTSCSDGAFGHCEYPPNLLTQL